MEKEKVAVLGLGLMGSGMAKRLISQGFAVTVYNRNPDKAEGLIASGARFEKNPRAAASGASVVLSMLTDDDAARAVWLGSDGAVQGASPGALLLESSSVSVGWIKELDHAVNRADKSLEFLDAPVTGSKNAAAAGDLNFLVGGSKATLERARPVLSAMGKQIVHLGPTGSGALLKLINNFVCGVQAVALAQAIAAIERSDLDQEKAMEVLTSGAPGSPIVKMIAPRMLASNFNPNFMLRLITKDLRYAQHETGSSDIGDAAIRTFQQAIDAGLGDQDFAAVVEVLRKSPSQTP